MITLITTTRDPAGSLPQLLDSIARQTVKDLEVIVVLHPWTVAPAAIAVPRQLKGKVRFLLSAKDLGFCLANTIAAKKAAGMDIFFINDDCTLDPLCISRLISIRKQYPTAVIQPKIMSAKRPGWFEYAGAAGGYIDKYGYCFCRGRVMFTMEQDTGQYDDVCDIFWASGAAFFIRKDLFARLGGFDIRFFAYHEETDLCWRIQRHGYRIIYQPKAIVHHQGEQSWASRRFKKIYLIHRNHYWLLAKNLRPRDYARSMPMKLFLDGCALIYYSRYESLTDSFAALAGSSVGFFTGWSYLNHGVQTYAPSSPARYPGSIVLAYFLKKKQRYSQL